MVWGICFSLKAIPSGFNATSFCTVLARSSRVPAQKQLWIRLSPHFPSWAAYYGAQHSSVSDRNLTPVEASARGFDGRSLTMINNPWPGT